MKYKGKELTEFKSDKNIAFNPKQHMIVWGDSKEWYYADIVGYFPDNVRPFFADNNLRYKHGAEIPKAKTNWEVYAERNGITTSLSSALDVFHQRGPACIFCPAINFCRHSERFCPPNFEKWAKSEYVEEK